MDNLEANFTFLKSYNKGQVQADDFVIESLREKFSVENKNARFSGRKFKGMDRKSVITATGRFDVGMFPQIAKYLKSIGVTCIYDDLFKNRVKSTIVDTKELLDDLCFSMRYYQYDAIVKGLNRGYGIFELGTGAGKSLLTASLCENVLLHKPDWKILIVVPGKTLHSQLGNDFEKYNVQFNWSRWGANYELEDTNVVIVNNEFLTLHASNNKWIKNVDMVIADEAHKIHGESTISKVVNSIKTPHKFGMTGTLPKDIFKRWKIIGTFGEVIYRKPVSELKNEGFLTESTINMIKLIHHNPPVFKATKLDKNKAYIDEVEWITTNKARNKPIADKAKSLDRNSLILVDRLAHGETFLELLKDSGKDVIFIHGGVPEKDRQELLRKMEVQDNIIAIAMGAIFSTGINVKNIHHVIFGYGGKSFIRIIQSIGRGLRLHDEKDVLEIHDFYDNVRYSDDHAQKRLGYYTKEDHKVQKTKIPVL